MIYEFPDIAEPIRQGDIFMGLPRVDISLNSVIVVSETGESIARWADIANKGELVNILAAVRPVTSIVATQDCDAIHSRDITLCEIRRFKDVEGKCKDTVAAKKWKSIITQQARINQKWFYLPPEDRIGFSEKMAVDFMVTLRVSREELEQIRELRKGRLNAVADEHFRERIGEFFRRYPYNEWYPLNREELKVYRDEYPDIKPYSWQDNDIIDTDAKK